MGMSGILSPLCLESGLRKQEADARGKLLYVLENQLTRLIPTVILSLLNASLTNRSWSVEEEVLIRKIATVLESIAEQRRLLESYLSQLMEPPQAPIEGGDNG